MPIYLKGVGVAMPGEGVGVEMESTCIFFSVDEMLVDIAGADVTTPSSSRVGQVLENSLMSQHLQEEEEEGGNMFVQESSATALVRISSDSDSEGRRPPKPAPPKPAPFKPSAQRGTIPLSHKKSPPAVISSKGSPPLSPVLVLSPQSDTAPIIGSRPTKPPRYVCMCPDVGMVTCPSHSPSVQTISICSSWA